MNVILIEKDGNIYEKNVKTLDKIYSLCGYRSNKEFQLLHQWEFDANVYELYGKKTGKKDKENIYNFPIEMKEKYYGTVCIIKKNMNSISLDEWNIFLSFNKEKSLETTHLHSVPAIVTKLQRISTALSVSVNDNASVSNQSDGDPECDADCDYDYETDTEDADVDSDTNAHEPIKNKNEDFVYPHIDELKYENYEDEY